MESDTPVRVHVKCIVLFSKKYTVFVEILANIRLATLKIALRFLDFNQI
jgi:hypothetical protein